MTAPFADADGPSGWAAGDLTAEMMQDEIVTPGNTLPRGLLDSARSGSTVTLATAGTSYAGLATVTITLTETRRIECRVQARYQLGTATEGQATVNAAYNSGSSASAGSAVIIGVTGYIDNNSGTTGINSARSGPAVGDVVLGPGTYTFYPLLTRTNGGSNSDLASSFDVRVHDVGAN